MKARARNPYSQAGVMNSGTGARTIQSGSGLACRILAERGLRRRQPCDRHAERRARDIVERELVAEAPRGRTPAVLAANADLELGARLATAFDPDAHKLAHALAVDGDEGIKRNNSARHVEAEKARRVITADPVSGLGQVVGAKGKELGALGDIAGAQGRTRQLDHGADLVFDPGLGLERDR